MKWSLLWGRIVELSIHSFILPPISAQAMHFFSGLLSKAATLTIHSLAGCVHFISDKLLLQLLCRFFSICCFLHSNPSSKKNEERKKGLRLAPSNHTMTWFSLAASIPPPPLPLSNQRKGSNYPPRQTFDLDLTRKEIFISCVDSHLFHSLAPAGNGSPCHAPTIFAHFSIQKPLY